jgi:hypothetical protein
MDEAAMDLACRLDTRRRSIPRDSCEACGINWLILLLVRGRTVLCYCCDAKARGLSGMEDHHLGGRPSSFLFRVPANLHRILSQWQDLAWRKRVSPGTGAAARLDLAALLLFGPLLAGVVR